MTRQRTAGIAAAPPASRLPDPGAEALLAARLGIHFANPRLFRLALTHRSALHDWTALNGIDAELQSNERLEFLGDAVLGAIVADFLYRVDAAADEGTLTRHRVAVVRAETLVTWAREVGVPEALYLGNGEQVTEGSRDRMLAGAFEAIVGAIYLDGGAGAAERFVRGFLERDLDALLFGEISLNPKGRLQEILQEHTRVAPVYVTLNTEGPDHARRFTEGVRLGDEQLGVGRGKSKREAQQAAAQQALTVLSDGETLDRIAAAAEQLVAVSAGDEG